MKCVNVYNLCCLKFEFFLAMRFIVDPCSYIYMLYLWIITLYSELEVLHTSQALKLLFNDFGDQNIRNVTYSPGRRPFFS